MRFDLYIHDDSCDSASLSDKLDEVLHLVRAINHRGKSIMAAIDDLVTQVATTDGVVDSAIVLIQGIKAQLDALANLDPRIAAISADLGAKTEALAAAVAAGSPPPPPV